MSVATLVPYARAFLVLAGGVAFGLVVGWLVYRTVSRAKQTQLSDVGTIIGVIGGAAVTALFPVRTVGFSGYCIGLAVGFFAYLNARKKADPTKYSKWLGLPEDAAAPASPASIQDPGRP